ncbi:MAG: cupin [Chloroflexi bacterium]|nr:cupin [Chloroflexota bacterium]
MLTTIETNVIFTREESRDLEEIAWNKHATFPGVYLKHLVKGDQTDGKFSCHLVKVEAGCELGEHIHTNNWEIHEIVIGDAVGYLEGKEMTYTPGNTAIIPAGSKHRVVAGEHDLYIRAKFIPALV